ncbi:MAG: glucosamine-6-phosphate deaminase [Clostridiales bacterium]|nr:glucosamine-6-phosphate deaminase [Clostridiales bacterium]
MKLTRKENYEALSAAAAKVIIDTVKAKPDAVLGLATGSTPIGTYKCLVAAAKAGEVDFSRVKTVNLDEYLGLTGDHPQSYRYFMETNLFREAGFTAENTNLPNGAAADADAECRRYDALVEALGGIDLQLLGIGNNGHIGFNEPDDVFTVNTHTVDLAPGTIAANARLFAGGEAEVPRRAVTIGMGAIMKAKKVLLIASGEGKKDAVRGMLYGPVTPKMPASVLQLHGDAEAIVDFDTEA